MSPAARPPRGPRKGPTLFRKILIANRGEIAVRVIRTCRRLGISSVAVCSEADRNSLHVRMADEAWPIGPAPAPESYLRIEAILEAAKRSGAEAIHPGYGFLAENPEFAQACRDARLVFIGPSAPAMRKLGNKIEARKRMTAAGVPVIPGVEKRGLTAGQLRGWADRTGYPILLKAAAGGGGRGMRIVRSPEEVEGALATARSEARSAFGDDTVFAERYLEGARHIEVQILVDHEGRGISLGERECSIQRRHQKLVEETPSPVVDEGTRRRLGSYALKACRAAGYVNAGTVEFVRDLRGRFYFLEINARLQVEHPVTEAVTGLDLVESQIRIAAGEPLPAWPRALRPRGWALECRIQAEDPENGFRPSPGRIRLYRPPTGPRVRVDGGVAEGDEVSLYYDSLLAKLITWGRSRREAVEAMAVALAEFRIAGVPTTLAFHRRVMADPEFRRGEIDTGYAERLLSRPGPETGPEAETAALLAAAHLHLQAARRRPSSPAGSSCHWVQAGRQAQAARSFLRNPWREP
jgi:acetyl-CoA carboxylase biotin carboxylase subunit